MKKKLCFLLFFLAGVLVFDCCRAFSIPDRAHGYVMDLTGTLSSQTRQRLEKTLADFEGETSNQVVVAIFPSLEGQSLEDFSIRLAERWQIGQKGKQNGVILLVMKEDRLVRIEVGYGLEGALPDALASLIIQNEILPAFREGDFDRGIENGVRAILAATRGEYKAQAPTPKAEEVWPWLGIILVFYFFFPLVAYLLVFSFAGQFFGWPVGALWGFLFVAILLFLRRMILRSAFGETLSGRSGRSWGWSDFSGGGFSGGGSGGFSGGGGSFGGGGASGRW